MSFNPDFVVNPEIMSHYTAVPPLTGPSGNRPVLISGGSVNNQGFVITRNSNFVDVLVRWYDYFSSDIEIALGWTRGTKDIAWRVRPDGLWQVALENQPSDMAYGVWRHTFAPGNVSPVFMKRSWEIEGQYWTNPRDLLKIEAVNLSMPYLETEYIVSNFKTIDDATTNALLFVEIDSYLRRFVAQSVMSGINEAGWNTHLAALRALRVDEYTAIAQKYYIPVR